jgi:GH15 family glucan-1,4-alpha-glucosidase
MAYLPIENYGVIGDLHTVALVGTNGSIDWLCFPRFDSPGLFSALLDSDKGGHFRIAPALPNPTCKQLYWPDTNVLITRFLSEEGVGEIADFMPIHEPGPWHGKHQLVRRVTSVRGRIPFEMECQPAFNFARDKHALRLYDAHGAAFHTKRLSVGLAASVPMEAAEKGGVRARFELEEGESATFLLQEIPRDSESGLALHPKQADRLFESTVNYWRSWLSQCTYRGRWREMVHRSALVLKLLVYEPTGAIVAAPTCGLPELVGGERNWDYRYTWVRDAAFTVYSFLRIGFVEEATQFMRWIDARGHELSPEGTLQILYDVEGRPVTSEEVLGHLDGYKGSKPVRVGNAAHKQVQLDIYGELMDSVYIYNKYGSPISYDLWQELRRLLNWVCDHWQEPDKGIWEVRGGPQQFVYSKVMCWVALDRGLRIATWRSFPADWDRWMKTRDQIYEQVQQQGWDDRRHAFTQHYGNSGLDASALMMPLVFFLSPTDPRMLQTLDSIRQPRSEGGLVSGASVYRYDHDRSPDGLEGTEGTFNLCTFWLVEALTRASRDEPRRLDEARLVFEKMLGYANHLGLYSEQTGRRGESLGNFPQALTHLALISAAVNLDRALNPSPSDWPGMLRSS